MIRLRLTADFLQVDQAWNRRMREDMMASLHSRQLEAKSCGQIHQVFEPDVAQRALREPPQHLPSVHVLVLRRRADRAGGIGGGRDRHRGVLGDVEQRLRVQADEEHAGGQQ